MAKEEPEFWKDVQALVGKGLVNRKHSRHLLLRIADPAKFKRWLAEDLTRGRLNRLATTDDVDGVVKRDPPTRGLYQIAFTPAGLIEMGAGCDVMKAFPEPFLAGMAPAPKDGAATTRRAGILGDVGANDQRNWRWGGATGAGVKGKDIHVLLMLFSRFEGAVDQWMGKALSPRSGLALACGGKDPKTACTAIYTRLERPDDESHAIEHFGFLDGVSQPMIKGLKRAETARLKRPESYRLHALAPGEFVLGQTNERNVVTPWPEHGGFGKNGSYLVVRELAQHVGVFNRLVRDLAHQMSGSNDQTALEDAAAKIMGRRRDGAPLTDQPRELGALSSFGFAERDSGGLRCPIGSHVRRANPRDSREDDPEIALRLSKRHRIIRRGRIYGKTAANEAFDAEDCDDQGLLFICVNADIAQQFEFIQQTWLNNPTFAGLDGEVDPVVSGVEPGEAPYTAPDRPISAKVARSEPLVTVKGGAYFFLPGLKALKWLADQPTASAAS